MKTGMTLMIGLVLSSAAALGSEGDERFNGGPNDGWGREAMSRLWALDDVPQVTLTSAPWQVFDWTAPSTALATLTIGAWEHRGTITNGCTLRITVPPAWQCRFDDAASAAFGGGAAGKTGTMSYSGDGRALLIPVTADFADGDTLTIAGLRLTDLKRGRAGDHWLRLDFTGDGAPDTCDLYALRMNPIQWPGGAYDGWGLATSAPMEFYLPNGTLLRLY